MRVLTLNILEEAFEQTKKIATPHREPTFERLREDAEDGGDAVVKGTFVFLEECNTGYDGALKRYNMSVSGRNGERLSFQIDLLPYLIGEKDSALR